ncbi:MAG: AraC family transcriptional regulator [Rhodobacterales bacterium]|nr:MAG: AraC family transcriptional regulator [Rhodobacterales bacterium]
MTTIPAGDRLSISSIGHTSSAGRWRTESMRAHASPRLIVFTKGQGRITVAGRVRGFGPNNVVYLPAGTLYGVELGTTGFAQIITIPEAMAYDWPDDVHHLRLRDVSVQKELAILLDQLERELLSDEAGCQRAAHHRLALLAIFLERQLGGEERSDPNAAERLVEAYAGLVAEAFHQHKGVADYAAALGVTPTHLSRCCKAVSGRPAHALLADRRMFEARKLLRNSKAPVAHIARDLGFSSPAYFTRAFRAAEGASPTEFRAKGPVALN